MFSDAWKYDFADSGTDWVRSHVGINGLATHPSAPLCPRWQTDGYPVK
jgi:hypothetical protein